MTRLPSQIHMGDKTTARGVKYIFATELDKDYSEEWTIVLRFNCVRFVLIFAFALCLITIWKQRVNY